MPTLFDPLTIRSITIPNRIAMSPMCMYSCADGRATDWHLVHLGARAAGGTGLIVAEATAVSPEGRISPSDAGLWSDDHIEPWTRVTRFIREHGMVPAIQLAHAGRKAGTREPWNRHLPRLTPHNGGWIPVGPSPLPFDTGYNQPHALTVPEIHALQSRFRDAARRALDAGFQAVEIHSAHGYLIHQFLSPIANHRADDYGGPFDHRIRFLIETARAVRTVWPDTLPLFVRLSCTDWIDGAWDIQQSVELARRLQREGVDLIDCSSGYIAPNVNYPVGPLWQAPLSEQIRRETGILTAAVGEITTPQQADELVRTGRADVVMLARQSLRDPHFALTAARALGVDPRTRMAHQYDYAV